MSKVWLITGSSRGLGRALAEAVLAAGHRLVATARNPAQLADLVERYPLIRIRAVALNVTDDRAADHAVGVRFVVAFGRVECSSTMRATGMSTSIEDTSLADFRAQIRDQSIRRNQSSPRPPFRSCANKGEGAHIQLSSIGGRVGALERAPYSAAKWGVEGFSEVLSRKRSVPLALKVTIIEPGGFRTDFARSSTAIRGGRPEYDSHRWRGRTLSTLYDITWLAARRSNLRRAAVIIQIASLDEPPTPAAARQRRGSFGGGE